MTALEKLPYPIANLPVEINDLLIELVPQMVKLLKCEMDDHLISIHDTICRVLATLGPKAQAAVPALFDQAEKYPRFELNVMAIGAIGGPGVVRRLLQWTYWQGEQHDRKRTDSAFGAIRSLGESAIQELIEIAKADSNDPHERTRALLCLLD